MALDERRDSLRQKVDPREVRIQKPASLLGATIVDLSATGGGLLVPSHLANGMDDFEIHMKLGPELAFDAKARIARREPTHGERQLLGLSFENLEQDSLGVLSQFLMDRHEQLSSRHLADDLLHAESFGASIRNQVQGLLDYYLFRMGNPLKVYSKGDEDALPVEFKAIAQEVLKGIVLIRLQAQGGNCRALARGQSYLFFFSGTNSLNLFFSSVWKIDHSSVWITFPGRIQQTGFRESLRTRLNSGEYLEMRHPRLAGVVVTKPIVDVAARGLSFPVNPRKDALFPGEFIKDIRIHTPNYIVRTGAVIRSVRKDRTEGGFHCGMELQGFYSKKDEEAWDRFMIQTEYPSSHLGGSSDVDELWKVLESSGYLDDYVSEKRDYLTEEFFSCWRRNADNHLLGRFLLLKRDKKPVGTVSVSLVYPGTWMVHHFGIDKSARLDKRSLFSFARDAYCSLAYLLRQMSSIRHWLVFFDSGNRWKNWICTDFVSRYPNEEDFVYDSYSLFKWFAGTRVDQVPCGDIKVVSDERFDGLLSDRLRTICHPLEFEAYSYSRQGLCMKGFERACTGQGYERSRSVFYALYRGKPVAALLAETGQEGVNIFGLMNRCSLVEMVEDVPHHTRTIQCLLYRAIKHYQARGKQEFLFMGKEDMAGNPLFLPLGFRFVTRGIRLLAGKKILPTYLNYLDELLRILHG